MKDYKKKQELLLSYEIEKNLVRHILKNSSLEGFDLDPILKDFTQYLFDFQIHINESLEKFYKKSIEEVKDFIEKSGK